MTANSDISLNRRRLSHIDRRPSIPFSPPHQSYDNSRVKMGSNDFKSNFNYYESHYSNNHQQLQYQHMIPHHNNCMIPSPPPQSVFKPDLRRMSLDESPNGTLNNTLRRQSADPHLYHPVNQHHREPRRKSLQQYNPQIIYPPTRSPKDNLGGEVIHLPPLRSIVTNNLQGQQRTSETILPPPKHHYSRQDGIVEVDAAVAMMQLASRRQAEAKVNY